MESHNSIQHSTPAGIIISVGIMFFSWILNTMSGILDHYDSIFEALSLLSMFSVCLANFGLFYKRFFNNQKNKTDGKK